MRQLCNGAAMICVAALFPMLLVSAPPVDDAVRTKAVQLLKVIQKVEAEGRGNVAAAGAWRELAQLDPHALPVILAAIDEEQLITANWIRSAVDAIAERAIRSGAGLPQTELEKFLKDTSHAPRARRLAFEWLLQVNPHAEDRLIPTMLHDPSVEFRRDAVARLIAAGQKEEKAGKDRHPNAVALYKEALTGARNEDQVKQIVERLGIYGETVDLPTHFGFLMRWKLIGPFDNTEKSGFDRVYPPEEAIDLQAEYKGKSSTVRWIDYVSEDNYGMVDINKGLVEEKGVAAYAFHEFTSDIAQDVELRVGGKNAFKLWVNGALVYNRDEYHHGTKLDHYRAKARLKEGKNAILLKVCQNELVASWTKVWRFQIRVCDAAGTAILSTTREVPAPNPADSETDKKSATANAKGGA